MSDPLLQAEAGPVPGLSVGRLLRQATWLSVSSMISGLLIIPIMFVVARWLGPADFGTGQFVVLVYMYAALLRTGSFEGGVRQYIYHSARGENREAMRAQNVGLTMELAASAVPGVLLALYAFSLDDGLQRLGFLLSPVAVTAASLGAFLSGLYAAREHFPTVAKVSLARTLIYSAVLLAAVPAMGAAALFVAPIVADAFIIGLYAIINPRLEVKPSFDRALGITLFKMGFPLGAAAVVYWAYRLVGNTAVALFEDARTFGVYSFAAAPIAILLRMLSSIPAVLIPSLWSEMAVDVRRAGSKEGRRLMGTIAAIAGVTANLAQAVFPTAVQLIAPSFEAAVPIFEVLALNIVLLSISAFPSLVLDSPSVNRQTRHLMVLIVALVVNALANLIVLSVDMGALAVAWNDIWVQAIVIVVIFMLAKAHLQEQNGSRFPIQREIVLSAALTGAVALVLHLTVPKGTTGEAIGYGAVRVGFVLLAWAGATWAYRRSRSA